MTSTQLIAFLQEFSRDKLAARERHVAGAQRIQNYDFNNTYQYIINREDTQVQWLRDALGELGSVLPDNVSPLAVPSDGKGLAAEQAVIADDLRQVQTFLDKWKPRVATLTHARNRKMLDVILGEAVEQKRFFEQMTQGRDDVLGRRTGGETTGGGVLPVRWLA